MDTYIAFDVENNDKDQSVIMLEYQKIKTFSQKVTLQVVLKRFLRLKKLKNIGSWRYVIEDLLDEEIIETLYEK